MRKKASSQKSTGKNHKAQIRIIGGQWRGRKLPVADVEGLRPTGDRIRETLFNWLQGDIRGARCLDLFAGTGALGLEALSRYADEVVFIENNKTAVAELKKNLDLLNAENAKLLEIDALKWLKQESTHRPFDIIFLDPPFSQHFWKECLLLISKNQLLNKDALVYVESPKEIPLDPTPEFRIIREKIAGQVHYCLWRCN